MVGCSIFSDTEAKDNKPDNGIPRLVEISLESEDIPIASFDVTQYGAIPNNEIDSTEYIQKALNDAETAGGGVVFVPNGKYKILGNLVLPENVTLRGDWSNPDKDGLGKGTILMAYAGKNSEDEKAFITFKNGATIRDLTIWYPEQDNAKVIKSYPYTIENDYFDGYYGGNIFNLTLVNAYKGIKAAPNNCHYFRNIYGTVLKEGFFLDRVLDIGRFENVQLKPDYWSEFSLGSRPSIDDIREYTRQDSIGIHMNRNDWGYLYDVTLEGYHTGIIFNSISDGGFNGQLWNIKVSDSVIGIEIKSLSDIGIVIGNSDFRVSGKNNKAVLVEEGFDGNTSVSFNKCSFSSLCGSISVLNGKGVYNFVRCSFNEWSELDYAIQANSGTLVLSACSFEKSHPEIYLGENLSAVTIYGNEFKQKNPNIYIKKETPQMLIDLDKEKAQRIADMPIEKNQTISLRKPESMNVFVVTDFGAKGDGTIDNTEAFQKTIDRAERKGGGTVYVPSGRYVINGHITIKSKVELRGSSDGPKHYGVTNRGTVLIASENAGNENGTEFISMMENSGLVGLNVFYPNQHYKNITKYPPTVKINGKSGYVRNSTFVNSYIAIKTDCEDYLIDYVRGMGLETFIEIEGTKEKGVISNIMCTLGDWQDGRREENAPPQDWWETMPASISNAITLKDCQNVYLFNNFSFGVAYGVKLIGKISNVYIHGHGVDASLRGIVFDSASKDVVFVNTQLVGVEKYVYASEKYSGDISFYNTLAWGPSGMVEVNGKGNTIFQQWKMGTGSIKINGGNSSVQNCYLFGRPDQVILGDKAENVHVLNNVGNSYIFGIENNKTNGIVKAEGNIHR